MARGVHRVRAPGRAVELRAVLLGRGRRRGQPVPLHRRRAARGAEVLPRHPAGRRGPPRHLLQALHARGLRHRRRLDGQRPERDQAPAHARLPQDLRPPRHDGRRTARRPLPHEARRRRHALPHRHRGRPRPARPAPHLHLPRGARAAARVPRRHGQRLRRRAAPHRLRRQAPLRPQARRPRRRAPRRRRPPARRHALHRPGPDAARLGRELPDLLRLLLRQGRRRGRDLADDQAPLRRPRARDAARPRRSCPPA